MNRFKTLLCFWLACLTLTSPAWANGRYPRAVRLIQNPVDPNRLVLAGTFGLAVTDNGGQSWNYVCESAFSDPNTILDPLIGYTKDGTLYTGTDLDLRRSDQEACEFDVVLGGQDDELVPDYTFDVDGQSLLALVSTVVDGNDQVTVQASPDGDSWEPLGEPIKGRSALTLDVAPSDDQRLYISAMAPELDDQGQEVGQRGVLLVSSDRGDSWEERDIPGTSFEAQPFIARVDPTDPDVVYVRVNGKQLDEFDLWQADDALLVSQDAGQTWDELIRQPAKILAFALSPDGTTVLAGYGQSDDSTVSAVQSQYGIYRINQTSSDSVEVEHSLPGKSTHCLTWTSEGLFVCLEPFDRGVGFTNNHDFTELEEVTPLLTLNRLDPPRACPGDSEAAACLDRWEMDCMRLLSCGAVPTTNGSAGAGGADPMEGGDGGVGGTDGNGGSRAGPTQAASNSGGAGGTAGKSKESSGCACRLPNANRPRDTEGVVTLACLLLGFGRYERRRRRTRSAITKGSER